ncbi:DUF6415 family natural product biosynthesis protein [Streptomyces griseorubiginosus]|uniref:DUF6415 family natural product biosynthesis protein n=1 Tax=Streptomyces griseorubiginosus TaxID=67304 RepID=UPI0036EF560A
MPDAISGLAVPSGATAEIDVDTIRETYGSVLDSPAQVPGPEHALLGSLLRGHLQLLMPEVTASALCMQGEQRLTALHVTADIRRTLAGEIGTSAKDLWGPATQCRALLTLYQYAGPLARGHITEASS